jgi:hypothetical protein
MKGQWRHSSDGKHHLAGLFPDLADDEVPVVIQFGSMIPKSEDNRQVQDTTQEAESKKARERAFANTKKVRCELMLEARTLLKNTSLSVSVSGVKPEITERTGQRTES